LHCPLQPFLHTQLNSSLEEALASDKVDKQNMPE